MCRNAILFTACVIGCSALSLCGQTTADDALMILDNSESISQATCLNQQGHLLGTKEVDLGDQTLGTRAFFWDGEERVMPTLVAFTNMHLEALADNDLAVGYASRASAPGEPNLVAAVWQPRTQSLRGLPPAEGLATCHAMDVNSDGTRIVGYSVGNQKMVPCLWTLDGTAAFDEQWKCQILESPFDFNPFLMSGRIVISKDGTKIAASLTEALIGEGETRRVRSATYAWEQEEPNEESRWALKKICNEQLRLADINDAGVVVGSCIVNRARRAYHLQPDGALTIIEPLAGDIASYATGINNGGMVVGYSDDPPGPDGGPTAFSWSADGDAEPLGLDDRWRYSAALAINERGWVAGYLEPRPAKEGEELTDRMVSFVLKSDEQTGSQP